MLKVRVIVQTPGDRLFAVEATKRPDYALIGDDTALAWSFQVIEFVGVGFSSYRSPYPNRFEDADYALAAGAMFIFTDILGGMTPL